MTVRADKPWYTAKLSAEKRLRRKCERKYKNTQLESDKLLLKEQRNKYNNLLNSTKKDYIKNKIENAQSSKDLYKICDKLLNREQRSVLPSHDCATSLANTFVDYFKKKIELIHSNLEESLNTSSDQLTKFGKILTISCIPSVKFESTLTNPRQKKMINSAVTSRLDYCNSLL